MNSKRLCMIGGWEELYDKALSLGAQLVLLHSPEKLEHVGKPHERPAVVTVSVDIADVDACVAVAEKMHAQAPFDAVVSFTEHGLESAAAIIERLGPSGVRGNAPRPVRLTRDKLAMRALLATSGVPTIPYRRCTRLDDLIAFLEEVGDPVIVKPAKGAGSAGVALVGAPDAAAAAWEAAHDEAGAGGVIAEAYIEGEEFSVDTMSYEGEHEIVAIAEKLTTGAPHFVELGHQAPARLSGAREAQVAKVVTDFLVAIGQWCGPAHTEFKFRGDEVLIIESQTRTGGDQIWELNRLATGYDMHIATMRHLLSGVRMVQWLPHRRGAAVRFFSAAPGRIVSVEGATTAAASAGVRRFKLDAAADDKVSPLTRSSARLGYVVCDADTVGEARLRAEAAHARVKVVTDGALRAAS